MDSSAEACGRLDITYYGMASPPFDPQEPSYTCTDREVLLDLRNGYLISVLWQNSALASNLVLGVSG